MIVSVMNHRGGSCPGPIVRDAPPVIKRSPAGGLPAIRSEMIYRKPSAAVRDV